MGELIDLDTESFDSDQANQLTRPYDLRTAISITQTLPADSELCARDLQPLVSTIPRSPPSCAPPLPVNVGLLNGWIDVNVTNNGGLEATGVTLTDTLPPEVTFVGTTPGAPDCVEASGVVTCDLGTVSSGETVGVTIEVDAPSPFTGSIVDTAAVTLGENDPVPANNSDLENTTVVHAADYIFADGFESGDISAWTAAVEGP